TSGEHFQTRVQIVDVMESHRFRRFRAYRRTELRLTVMRADKMKQMQSHVFGWRRQIFPGLRIFDAQLSPDGIDQFETDRNMAHQISALIVTHCKARFRQLVLPKLSRVVEKNAGEQKIDIQLR